MNRIIGIDLGTSTSEMAYFDGDKPVLITNQDGKRIVPSVIGLDDEGQFIVGEKAQERYLLYPEKTVMEVKRQTGTENIILLGAQQYCPVELSAQILSYLKKTAETQLGEEVNRAVITVPAYFNNRQRQETIEAGTLAGFQVERIINEPTAAALSYGMEHMEEESHVLVYDFGGGTFDVTLLEMFDGVLDVKASNGDNQLGGKDMDEALMEYLIAKCQEEYQVDLHGDVYAMVKLKEEAVRCKIALSTESAYEIILPMLYVRDGVSVSMQETITIEQFEQIISELVERTRKPVQMVLQDAGITASEVNTILLVGGTTKIPYVKRYVEQLMNQEAKQLVDPDLAVATGAAIQAAMLDEKIDTETGIMITDVAPYPLGIRIAREYGMGIDDDYMDILIPRNVTIPTTRKQTYCTMCDNQTKTNIDIYQGEHSKATDNYFLGKFVLSGIPAKKAGSEKIEVSFSYDLNGVLDVRAKILSTGRNAGIMIETTAMNQNAVDTSEWKESKLAKKFRSTIRKAEKALDSSETWNQMDQQDLKDMIEDLKVAMIQSEEETATELEEEILDLLEEYEA